MSIPDSAWWEQARAARDHLAAQVLAHPAVAMIDIGLDPKGSSALPVLRVHLRPGVQPPALPDEVGGITVRTLAGDYQPQ
ncbi:MAG: hypothetical protein HGA45_21995 [Chloroflexales bacterium]|nr:hypothetical protein [Chloroflexales bacterium]